MSKITDYAFLFQKTFGTSGENVIGSFQLSQLNSSSVQSQLKAAGINTNSKQYKAAVKQMMSAGNGAMYGNIQGIKNLMSHYDKDGDYINPVNGLAGLLVTDENGRIVLANAATEQLFGYTQAELVGRPSDMLVPSRLRAAQPDGRHPFTAHHEGQTTGVGRTVGLHACYLGRSTVTGQRHAHKRTAPQTG